MEILRIWWRPIIEIFFLWYILYILFVFIKGTRAVQALKGIVVLIVIFLLTQELHLETISWILTRLFAISVIALVVIFQPELRRGLARIGQNPLYRVFLKEEKIIDEIVKAATSLSKQRIGSLIALEQEMGLKSYIESGIELDAKVTGQILMTIFMPHTPLHDGGVIIQGARINAASCLFPLSQNSKIRKILGTRHLAGLGLSEETDAVCIITSEETGIISVANKGRLIRDLDEESLSSMLRNIYKMKI